MKYLMYSVPSLVLLATSAYLASNQIDGWGWFLFVGSLFVIFPTSKT